MAAFLLVPAFGVGTAIAAGVVTIAGTWIADRAERTLGHDAHPIVIDEVAGMLLSLLWLPHTLQAAALAFLFFRVFDIVKPEPANAAQRLRGGFGIMADDLVAGVYANLATRAALALIGLVRHAHA